MLWFGIIFATVYAQAFSIFYKVGMVSFLIIICMSLIILGVFRSQYILYVKKIYNKIKRHESKHILIIVMCVVSCIGILLTIRVPKHYDTYLYHAQNIRWIEEYGVVKGLGNFHNRFAYNSSFMCLQVLFSFSWCVPQSLHTINGFLWCFMMLYSWATLKVYNQRKIFFSDILKVLLVFYLSNIQTYELVSSPHTDLMTMALVSYIIIRWVELLENSEKSYIPYSILCLFGVFTITVKLSAALILLLALKPAIYLIRRKKWKNIIFLVGSGLLIIIPFLVRNVLISGYLVYPYANIDLFQVDWKMPASQVEFDNHEIMAWGRGLNDVERYGESIVTWLPVWLEKNNRLNSALMILNIFILPVSIVNILRVLHKKRYDESLILLTFCVLFLGWLLTAPLTRYGLIYLFLQPLYFLNIIFNNLKFSKIRWKYIIYVCNIWICASVLKYSFGELDIMFSNYIFPQDYKSDYTVESHNWNGINVYIPNEGDQVSYNYFPSTPYIARLELIELRKEELGQGFKIKDKYKERRVSTYGGFLD